MTRYTHNSEKPTIRSFSHMHDRHLNAKRRCADRRRGPRAAQGEGLDPTRPRPVARGNYAETLHGNDTEHFFCKELDISPQRRRRSRSMRTDEARTRSAGRCTALSRCAVCSHSSRPATPTPSAPNEDGIHNPVPLVYSREPYPAPARSWYLLAVSSLRRLLLGARGYLPRQSIMRASPVPP